VINVGRGRGGGSELLQTAPLTVVLIAANVLAYIAQRQDTSIVLIHSGTTGGDRLADGSFEGHFLLWGPMVAAGEWWRLLTTGFLHASPIHLGANMLSLFFIGRALEPALGSLRTGLIYLVSLAAGSLGVMILAPGEGAIGASGAIFGLAGALLVIGQSRGIPMLQSGFGMIILLNLVFTFTIPGISIGGHIGGLIGGAAMGKVIVELERRRRGRAREFPAPLVAISLTAFAALMVVSYALARSKYPSVG
jgi:membrane associated rhomboid family serine protease